eukprot:COSAG06_NODE_3966_length_4712_cov_3.146976_6_plen_87_part_00
MYILVTEGSLAIIVKWLFPIRDPSLSWQRSVEGFHRQQRVSERKGKLNGLESESYLMAIPVSFDSHAHRPRHVMLACIHRRVSIPR